MEIEFNAPLLCLKKRAPTRSHDGADLVFERHPNAAFNRLQEGSTVDYQEFIEGINTGKIKQISFSAANYPHYKYCTIKSITDSSISKPPANDRRRFTHVLSLIPFHRNMLTDLFFLKGKQVTVLRKSHGSTVDDERLCASLFLRQLPSAR